MSASTLGRSVLELSTNQQPLRQGLTEARAETIRQTEAMKAAARIDLRANLLRLQSDYQQGQRAARDFSQLAARESAFDLRVKLEQYRSDLRQAENEQKASLRRMQQQSQESGGGGLGAVGGALLTGLGIGSGAALVQQGIGLLTQGVQAGKSAFIDYNSEIDNTRAQLLAFTRSSTQAESILRDLRTEADKTPFTFRELSGSIATLIPVSKQTGDSLTSLISLAETLAALNPAQGFEGATIALQNAAAGQTQSLQERFNISRTAITRFKEQGLSDLDAVRAALKAMGVDESIVANLSQTFAGRLSNLQDAINSLAGRIGQPIFEGLKGEITTATNLLSSPQVQQAGTQFTENMRAALADPALREGAKQLALALRDIAAAYGDVAAAAGGLTGGTLIQALRLFGELSQGARTLGDNLITAEKSLDGTGAAAKLFLAVVSGNPVTVFAYVIDELHEIQRQLSDPKIQAFLNRLDNAPKVTGPVAGQNTGPGSFPVAGPNPSGGQGPQVGSGTVAPRPFISTQPDYDPGEGVQAARGTNPRPAIAIPPPEEAQFDITANKSQAARYEALRQQGVADLKAFVAGFQSQDFDLFDKLRPQVQASFDHLFGSLDLQGQVDHGLQGLDTLTARVVDDIRRTGTVSQETTGVLRAAFGDQADSIVTLANEYGKLSAAQDRVTLATKALKFEQDNLTRVQKAAADRQQEVRDRVDELQRSLSALGKEAAAVARNYADQIARAQSEQTSAQEAATLHAAAYQAVLAGTTDEFLKQNDALDEQTRKIIETGNAQVRAALQAKAAQDSVVQGLERQENKVRLDFDERIRAARQKGTPEGNREANALTEQRDREIAKLEYRLQIERERAAVRGDEADQAKKPIEAAAQAQADEDKKRVDEAGKRVGELQDQAKVAADDYAARALAIQGTIDKEEERGRVIAATDKKAIDDAQTRVDNAKIVKDNADQEVIAQGKITDALSSQNTLLDTRFKAWKDFYEKVLVPAGIIMGQFANGAPPPPPGTTPPAQGGGSGQQSPIPGNVDDPGQTSSGGTSYYQRAASYRAPIVPVPSAPRYSPPVPPRAGLAAYSTLGAGGGAPVAYSRAGGTTTIHAPLTFPNAQFTSDIDVKRAVVEAAELAVTTILAGLDEDGSGGGAQSNWRA